MDDEPKTILVVDDEEVIRDICLRSLTSCGYHVELAENGIRALECLRETPVDVVFSDFKMPIMHGIELLECIKRDHPHIVVAIMTAFATIDIAIHAMKNGASDFILKPVKPEQIRIVAEKCFEKIKLNEENSELKVANQKLIDLQNMKNKFIAITSHELRTPVSHLKGFLGILTDEGFRSQLSEQEEIQCRQVIAEAIGDLEEMVTNMHNIINIESGKHDLRKEIFDIDGLLKQCVAAYQLIAKKRSQVLRFESPDPNLMVKADRGKLKGVFNELIQNAVKFTPDLGKIDVSVDVEGDYVRVCVQDSGVGIPETEYGKIFEKFYEVQNSNYHSTGKDKFLGGGLGLGLPSARTIVDAHGGGIKVKSKDKEGTQFLVYLPLASQPEPVAEAE